jgi:NAD(P)-dependent dehydrogenase (short-subunit alcohol dehydrogenase family)
MTRKESESPPSTPAVEDLLNLSGRAALVTGAGRGIGAAIAKRLAQAGAAIGVHYRTSDDGARTVVKEIIESGGTAMALGADLTNVKAVAEMFAEADESLGGFDILVNNAGIYPLSFLTEMPETEWDAVIDANLKSVFLCTQAAARVMIKRGQGGAIVNIASVEGETPAQMHSHYTSSKAGALMHTRSAALELGPHGIRVNAVSPGLIWRQGVEEDWPEGVARWVETAPLGRLGRPEDVADACLFLVAPASRWITGAALAVDGGILARPVF